MTKRLSEMNPADRSERINRDFKRSRQHSGKWRREAKEDYAFYAGDQWTDDDIGQLKEQLRPVITYNRVAPIIDSVSGTEVNNRQEVRFIPREEGDIKTNEILTSAAEWARDNCDAEDEETDAFMDALICGMGWTETRLDYDEDPDGQIYIDRTDPMEMYWDTAAKKKNLADGKYQIRMRDIDEEEFASIWPEWVEKIAPMSGQWDEGWTDDEGEAHFNDEIGYVGEEEDAGFDQDKRIYKLTEYLWWEHEVFYRSVNPLSGKIESMSEKAAGKIRGFLEAKGIPVVRQKRRKYYFSFLIGTQELETSEAPVQTGFKYQCVTGKRDRNKRYWYGMVRALKDPQRWTNKFFSQILHIINSQANSGLLAEQNAFADREEAEETYNAPDSIVWMEDGALSGPNPKVIPKPRGDYPQGHERLMQFSLDSFKDVTGVNMEMLGLADRMQPGILEFQRKQAALAILAPVFDSLRRYRKLQGRILLEYIQKYISDGRLIKVTGQEGDKQYLPLTRQDDAITYDIIVEEAPSSPNQREQVLQILLSALPALLKAGIPMPPKMLEYLPLPSALVEEWKQYIQQMSQKGQDSGEQALNQAKAQTEQTKALLNQAKAQGEQAQAQAQVARIAELTPVDAAQQRKFDASALVEIEKAETEQARRETMIEESEAQQALLGEKMQTEDARQAALRRQPNGS